MFDQLFEEPKTLKRHRDGPLANERLQFLAYHAARGSVRTTLRRIDNHWRSQHRRDCGCC